MVVWIGAIVVLSAVIDDVFLGHAGAEAV